MALGSRGYQKPTLEQKVNLDIESSRRDVRRKFLNNDFFFQWLKKVRVHVRPSYEEEGSALSPMRPGLGCVWVTPVEVMEFSIA